MIVVMVENLIVVMLFVVVIMDMEWYVVFKRVVMWGTLLGKIVTFSKEKLW